MVVYNYLVEENPTAAAYGVDRPADAKAEDNAYSSSADPKVGPDHCTAHMAADTKADARAVDLAVVNTRSTRNDKRGGNRASGLVRGPATAVDRRYHYHFTSKGYTRARKESTR